MSASFLTRHDPQWRRCNSRVYVEDYCEAAAPLGIHQSGASRLDPRLQHKALLVCGN